MSGERVAGRWRYRACAMAIAAVAWLGTRQQAVGPADRRFANGLSKPVLAVELQCGRLAPGQLVGDEPDQIRATLAWDEAFLVGYAALFVLVGTLLRSRGLGPLGFLVAGLGVAAAVCDHQENVWMRAVLDGVDACPQSWSLLKWSLLFGALAATTAVYVDRDDSTASIVIGLVAATKSAMGGFVGLFGVLRGTPAVIETGSSWLVAALVAAFLYFVTHAALRDGVGGVLDAMIEWKVAGYAPFAALARWPPDES